MTLSDERPLPETSNVTGYVPVIDDEVVTFHSKTREGVNSDFGMSMVRTPNVNAV